MDEENTTLEEPLNKNFREPKIRFSEFQDSWNYKRLSDFTSRLNRKNKNNQSDLVLTISAQYGLIDQKEFFNKNVSGSNIENYYLLKNGDFAYNRSYSKDYPYGAIKRLDNYECGVVSTLYIVFEPKSNVNSNYLKYYFETDKWNGQISLISGEGARNHGLLNLSPSDFFQTKHWIPSLDEQSEISVFLEKIFILESLLEQKLLTLKKYKEGLIDFEIKNGIEIGKLSDVVKVEDKTSLQSNLGKEFGKYPFFINNSDETSKYTDNYIFDGKHVIANTGGEAYIRYYNGKFSAMSDCLVLRPIKNPVGIYYCLKSIQNIINQRGFQGTGLKHLDQDWFFEQKVKIPKMSEEKLEKLESLFNRFTDILKTKNTLLAKVKKTCQKNMFI